MPKKLAVGARKAAMKGKRSATKRELIAAGADGRYAKRNGRAQVKESNDAGGSLSADRRIAAKKKRSAG